MDGQGQVLVPLAILTCGIRANPGKASKENNTIEIHSKGTQKGIRKDTNWSLCKADFKRGLMKEIRIESGMLAKTLKAPSGKDRIYEEKNKVEHFGVKLEDIEEEAKKDNQHQAIYQMNIKEDCFEKGSMRATVQEEDGDTSNNSSNDFIIIS
nr:hypothetical protein [Tanacetum cinerariifolium]